MKTCPLCDREFTTEHSTCPHCNAYLLASHDLDSGTIIRGKYRILRKLGQGGMGAVYLSEHQVLGGQIALKFLSGELGRDPRFIKRFRNEAKAAFQLRNPNIVECTDLDQMEDGTLFIAMEYIEGQSLRHAIDAAPSGMEPERALKIAAGIAHGLAAAHARGTVHRDIKPENIMLAQVNGEEVPKILDFGIASGKEGTIVGGSSRSLFFTPGYAAPEQLQGMPGSDLDGRTDLYALGIILYEMLTGHSPFESTLPGGWMTQQLQGIVRPLVELKPALAKYSGLNDQVLLLLTLDRDRRPAVASQIKAEFDRLLLCNRSDAVAITTTWVSPHPPMTPPGLPPRPSPIAPLATPTPSAADGGKDHLQFQHFPVPVALSGSFESQVTKSKRRLLLGIGISVIDVCVFLGNLNSLDATSSFAEIAMGLVALVFILHYWEQPNITLFYDSLGFTPGFAKRILEQLVSSGYRGHPKATGVYVARRKSGAAITIVVTDEWLREKDIASTYRAQMERFAKVSCIHPLTVQLADSKKRIHISFEV